MLHHTLPLDNATPTAFMFVCGAYAISVDNNHLPRPMPEENPPLLRAMLTHGADVHARAEYNRMALHYAVGANRLYTAELLLQYGADINAQEEERYTPLMGAVMEINLAMTHLLLTHGAKPDLEDLDGWTALARAVIYAPDATLVRDLLVHGANPNIKKPDGDTPLLLAEKYHVSHLIPLLRRGAK